jgi:hypothetical protein
MIYRSNLESPDLAPHFAHIHSRPMAHSNGHDVPSDWADKADDDPHFGLYKRCGFWTHDEAAILYSVVKAIGGRWLDIGAHTGWTGAHIAAAGAQAVCLEPMAAVAEFHRRYHDNMRAVPRHPTMLSFRSDEYFDLLDNQPSHCYPIDGVFDGVVIDGDHDRPHPLRDATNAAKHLTDRGVILLHDFIGRPVQEAVEYLLDHGFHCRAYWTPHMVACCWRGDFTPPVHLRDPQINWERVRQTMPDFDFTRCE